MALLSVAYNTKTRPVGRCQHGIGIAPLRYYATLHIWRLIALPTSPSDAAV
jgi:hypothetical protein